MRALIDWLIVHGYAAIIIASLLCDALILAVSR